MLEYGYYIFLTVVMVLMMLVPRHSQQTKLKKVFVFSLMLGLSFIVRLTPHSDMPVYIESMSIPLSGMMSELYYLKNGLYWISSAFLYQHLLGSEYLVLFTWDLLTFVLLLKICDNTKLPYSFILVYLLSFMGVLAFQNVYRQYIATIIFLYGLTLSKEQRLLPYILGFSSCLIHSSVILLLPIMLLYRRRKSLHPLLFFLFILLEIFLAPYIVKTDYQHNTGLNMNLYYLILILSLSLSIWGISRYAIRFNSGLHSIVQLLLYVSILTIVSFFTMGNSLYYERIALLLLQVLSMFLFMNINMLRANVKIIFELPAALIFVLPNFFFPSTIAMMENAIWLM